MNEQHPKKSSLIKKVADLTSEERDIINKRLRWETATPSSGNSQMPNNEPKQCLVTSDNVTFHPEYEDKAFDYETMLWCKDQIREKLSQKCMPDWVYYVGLNDFVAPQHLKGTQFNGAYLINVPDNEHATMQEIEYLHSMLRINEINMHQAVEQFGPGKYVLIYTTLEEYHLHPLERCTIILKPLGSLTEKIKNMLNELIETQENEE